MLARYSWLMAAMIMAMPIGEQAQGAPEPNLTLLTIADNIYTVGSVSSHEEHPVSGDAHFVVTSAGVVVIDTGGTAEFGRALLKQIRAVTDKPIRKVIYTHWHWDHVLGTAAFAAPDVEIIGHANIRKNFAELWPLAVTQARLGIFGYGTEFPRATPIPPTRTYRDVLRFRVGEYDFALHAAVGETDDHTLVHLPQQGVLFVGDHFNPMLGHPLSPEGDVEGFVRGLELIEKLAPKRIVHGHGEFGIMTPNLEALQPIKAVSRSIRSQVQALAAAGFDLEETQKRVVMPAEYENNAFARVLFKFVHEPFVNRVHRQTTGYYGASAVDYAPAPKQQMAQIWLKLAGGTDAVLQQAQALVEQGEYQPALELLQMILAVQAEDVRALRLQAESFEQLAVRVGLSNFYRYYSYLAAAQKARSHIQARDAAAGASAASGR